MSILKWINGPNNDRDCLEKIVGYVMEDHKTEHGTLIVTRGCNRKRVIKDMSAVKKSYHKTHGKQYEHSGYIGAEKRPEAIKKNKSGKKIKYIINRRPSSIKKLSKSGQYAAKKRERQKHPNQSAAAVYLQSHSADPTQ